MDEIESAKQDLNELTSEYFDKTYGTDVGASDHSAVGYAGKGSGATYKSRMEAD